MKCFVPEISWHNRDPVYSVDFQPKKGKNELFYRLASGGADCHVVIWHVTLTPDDPENHFAAFECAADLQRHQKCVNVVRFAPNSMHLASGDDDGYIIIWKMQEDMDPPELPGANADKDKDKESWIPWKVLRGHLQDVYDLAWSPDSAFLASGSIDNTALLWDVEKRKNLGYLGEHKGFVQGIAWDPKGKYIATLSTDRNLRVFESANKRQIARCFKGKLPPYLAKEKDEEKDKITKLFHNDTLKTFFRRLTFTPLGELLITPCGVLEDETKNHDVSYVFTRGRFTKPALHLPSPGQYTVAVRCCPVLFKHREMMPSLFSLPYRAVYTIATRNALVLYDTEQTLPFGYVANIHYTGITDVTWSPDGRLLIASSSEGFCSVITFDKGEIGEEYVGKLATEEGSQGDDLITKVKCTDMNISPQELENFETDVVISDCEEKKMFTSASETIVLDNTISNYSSNILNNLVMEVDEANVEESNVDSRTPEKERATDMFVTPTKPIRHGLEENTKKTPVRISSTESMGDLDSSQCSDVSELSISIVGDEEDFISKEEQARRLMSPYRDSPGTNSPSRLTPKLSPKGSPSTPKSGRRINLITLSSPKSKRKL